MKAAMFLVMILSATAPVLALEEELSEEARKLVETHEKESHRLRLAYLQKLDALAARYRTGNEPAKAKPVEALIAEVEREVKEKENDDLLKPLVGTWRRNTDGKIWKFESTKGGAVDGKEPFTMRYDAERRRVVMTGKGWVNTLSFTDYKDLMNGSWEESGKQNFKLTRLK